MSKVSDTPKLLIISGPTATGKTQLAAALAKFHNGELVNADSRQVYRGLNIISGKDTHEFSGVRMWVQDVASVDEHFSVSLYRKLAEHAIADIHRRGKLPIIVGGTGLYIRSIIDPPETINIPPDADARIRWNLRSVPELQQELVAIDPKHFTNMNQSDRSNPRRLIRALEITAWGKKYGASVVQGSRYDRYWIGLRRTEDDLKRRITDRVKDRWDHGALDEARRFPTAIATGMKPMKRYLTGEATAGEAQGQWVREEVSYAKRQMTWFRRVPEIHWYDASLPTLLSAVEKDLDAWYT